MRNMSLYYACLNPAVLASCFIAELAHAQSLPAPPTSSTPVSSYEYDAEGHPTKSVVAPASRALTTTQTYDLLGRVRTATDPKAGISTFSYDLRDELTSFKDPRKLTTKYNVDSMGNTKQLASPDTGVANSSFDAAGNLNTRMDARGVLAIYSYDALNRLTQVVYHRTGDISRTFSWKYDQAGATFGYGIGRLTTAVTPDASTTFAYDALGRVESSAQASTSGSQLAVKYGYDSAGRLTKITYPSGRVFDYNVVNGQLKSITMTKTDGVTPLLDQIVIGPLGSIQSWIWSLTATPRLHERLYDINGRMVRHPLGVVVRDISYDDADRISRYTHYDAVTAQPVPSYDQSFSYDELNRLTNAVGTSVWAYAYDANGNRIASSSGTAGRSYAVTANSNRVTALTNPTRSMSYDAIGNTLSDVQTDSGSNYTATYSLEGRLASMTQGTSVGVEFGYDVRGRRVWRSQWTGSSTGPRVVTQYAYDRDDHLIGEYEANGTPISEYVWLDDIPVVIVKRSGVNTAAYAIHSDHLNTPRVVMDAQWNVRWRWLGEPFGVSAVEEQPTAGLPTLQQSLRFPGQQYESFGGRHYNHFRDYDPTIGRYVQSDPIGLGGGVNTYSYVNGSPLMYYDPYGLYSFDEFIDDSANFSAGWGDMLSFGITARIRKGFDIGSVDKCSAFYKGGEIFGFANGLALGWAQGTKAAAKAASGNNWANFSHSLFPKRFLKQADNPVANWMNRVGNRLNGDFVTPALHTRMDAAAQFGLSREWLAANPLFSPLRQLVNRMPYVPGAAAYGVGSAAMNSCGCDN